MTRLSAYFGIAVLATFTGQAWATPAAPETSGEASPVLTCFYECKRQFPLRRHLWKEVTTLMLTSAPVLDGPDGELVPLGVLFYDADENVIAATEVELGPFDLDELYVCRTLLGGDGVPVPEKGLIEVVALPNGGFHPFYGWIKNLVGKFNGLYPEPFRGRHQEVTGIGKTECRVTPPSVRNPEDAFEAWINEPELIEPRFIEGTGEPLENSN
jgi:hypothetical protein